ncbi:ankyrin repeat domain-containing protein [Arthrobacter sp. NPDC057388]|uniref:ankyrin repeat domain-containing protein n=1 Tax=Arthrobacter sp. NPDC057388 TaxID=3346116 RepID=UPI003641D5D3
MVRQAYGGQRVAATLPLTALLAAVLLAGCASGTPSAGGSSAGSPTATGPTAGGPTAEAGAGAGSGTASRPPSSAAASATPSPPASAPATRPVLSPAEQQKLDQRLVLAAKANDVALVAQLIRDGGNVNAKDSIQDSAFLYAGAEGFNGVLRLTLANGADVRSTNRYGGTALIPASEHGHVETVRILIAAGVPVNHVNKLGWTAMQEAILLNNGGPRQQDVVRQLLDAGADPNIRDPQGRTALDNAERLGFTEIARLIRGRG